MRKLFEGARAGDLDYLIAPKIHFDEYESKMGRSDSVITASFKIKQKEPAEDLVSFLENGYEWVLDADVSTGEIDDGEYLVFLEVRRRKDITDKMMEMLDDLQHLTNIKPKNWKFKWYKQSDYQPLTRESLRETLPMTPEDYKAMTGSFEKVKEGVAELLPEIMDLKRLSGIK
jgi:hypothetical protein